MMCLCFARELAFFRICFVINLELLNVKVKLLHEICKESINFEEKSFLKDKF